MGLKRWESEPFQAFKSDDCKAQP